MNRLTRRACRFARRWAVIAVVPVMLTALLANAGSALAQPARIYAPTRVTDTGLALVPLYRMWNPTLTDHFYTTSQNEAVSAAEQALAL